MPHAWPSFRWDINVQLHKIGVLMVSGAFAGAAGILQLYYLLHISPICCRSSS